MFHPPADSIIRAHQTAAPVKVAALAQDLGIRVWESAMPDEISGKLRQDPERGGSSGYAIYVNKTHHRNRQRFTVAHELAHFLLHRKYIEGGLIEDDTFYRSYLSNRYEVEANKAAAEILMPWHLISQKVDAGHGDPKELAGIFEVSETAMRIRLGYPT